MTTQPVVDYIVIAIPEDNTLTADELRDDLNRQAEYQIMVQYERPPRALLVSPTEWLITSDPEELARFQPTHNCPACLAGHDRARAFLAEFPDRRLAVGNLHYTEVW